MMGPAASQRPERTGQWAAGHKKVNIGLCHQSKEHNTMTFCLEPRWLRPGFQPCERKIIEAQSLRYLGGSLSPLYVALCAAFVSDVSRGSSAIPDSVPPAKINAFLQKHCTECHDSETQKGGLDLTSLGFDLSKPQCFSRWLAVEDRVSAGEMPPKKKPRPLTSELKPFTNNLSSALMRADLARVTSEGRAIQRRLNRYEYENTLRDLLSLPYLEVKSFLPEDSEAFGFNKVGQALDVSHVQMARYLSAAEFALRQAIAPQADRPASTTNRYYAWDQGEFFGAIKLEGPENRRTFPLIGLELQTNLMAMAHPKRPSITDPELRNKQAMAVVVSTYEPTEIRFGRFHAPVTGRYRLRFCAYGVWMGAKYDHADAGRRSEPVTIYADTPPRLLRKLGSFDVNPEPTVREMEVWLLAGETIRPDAARFFRSRPPDFKNPLAGPDGMPGLAFAWMDVEGPMIEQWPPAGHQVLFGDLPIQNRPHPTRRRFPGTRRRSSDLQGSRNRHPAPAPRFFAAGLSPSRSGRGCRTLRADCSRSAPGGIHLHRRDDRRLHRRAVLSRFPLH